MSKRYSVKSKLFLMGAVISALSFFMGTSNYLGLKKTSESYRHVTSVNLTSTELLGEMLAEYRSVRIHLRTLGLDGLSPEAAKQEIHLVKEAIAKYEKASSAYAQIDWAEGEQALFEKLNQAWSDFKAVGGRALALYQQGDAESLKELKQIFFVECPQSAQVYNEAIENLIRFQNEQSKSWVAKAQSDSVFANGMSIALIAVQMIFSMGVAFYMGRGLNQVFSSITEKLTDEADEVTKASERIQQTSGELSLSASDQANALQKTAAAATEVSAMATKNAENAAMSHEITRQSTEQTNRGRSSVQSMISSIGEIDEANAQILKQVEVSNQQMIEFVNVIHEIGEKTKVINDIVFQTKLLSFNASVEAARAGEHGKGFAVVAEEVGNLAQMSGNAAHEISTMLQQSSSRVDSIASETKQKVEALIQTAKSKVQHGMKVSRECDEVFEEIVSTVEKVSQMVAEIAQGSHEQSQGVEEILNAIHQLDSVTQKNANSSQSAAADAHQLNLEAQKMRDVVNDLTVVVQGSKAA